MRKGRFCLGFAHLCARSIASRLTPACVCSNFSRLMAKHHRCAPRVAKASKASFVPYNQEYFPSFHYLCVEL